MDLILASSSPRRQSFLRALGLSFRTLTADLDETPHPDEGPVELVARLALDKAAEVARHVALEEAAGRGLISSRACVIVAADTTVAREGIILNKPADAADAQRMLATLRGVVHQVHSAVAVRTLDEQDAQVRVNTTHVLMRNYSDAEILDYIATGDPLDKAGAYGLQHEAFAPAAGLEGCLAGVVGLPLNDLVELLAAFGVAVTCPLAPICEAQAAFACCTRVSRAGE